MINRIALRGGVVVDGTGAPPLRADVLVERDRIAAVVPDGLPTGVDADEIDAAGHVVAPGFVDVHSHADVTVLAFGQAESAIRQGVTTIVNGNCGLGPAPLDPGRDFRRVTIAYEPSWGVDVDWQTFEEYLGRLDDVAVNVATLVPHGAVRNAVMGLDDRPPRRQELDRLKGLVEDAMRAGAVGVSTGLEYQPGCYADVDELSELAAVAGCLGGVYATHVRNRGDSFGAATREAIEIARRAEIRLQLSHFAPRPYAPPAERAAAFDALDQLEQDNHPVWIDTFPEIWGPGLLMHLLPDDVAAGTPAEILRRLADPHVRGRVSAHFAAAGNFLVRAGGYEQIFISSSPARRDYTGRALSDLAADADVDVGTWTCDALLEAGSDLATVGIRHLYAVENDVRALLERPNCSLGSDGVVTCGEGNACPYPWNQSTYGYAARTLGHYVREVGLLTLADAIRRLSALPAEAMGLDDRGRLLPGLTADLVVFDADKIADRATPDDVARYPTGIAHVLVNGVPVVADGKTVPGRPGRRLT